MPGEEELIERIRSAIPSRSGQLRTGIGDDAAVLRPVAGKDSVLTCDWFLEGVHFLPEVHPADSVGYKSLMRATSDIAAMGAIPQCFLLTLALPASRTGKWLDGFLAGMARAARELKLVLAGGDTAQFSRVAISILVAGRAAPRRAVRRDTARPGDCLFVTGGLGYAQLGLEVLKRKIPAGQAAGFLEKHLYPRARVEFGAWLSRRGYASAMIDVSDGFSTDLIRLCKASGVGARILEFTLPAPVITPFLKSHRLHPLRAALHGGDDYELLFTVPAKAARRIPGAYRGVRIVFLGRITRAREGIRVVRSDGSSYALHPLGWEHFRKP